MSTKLYELKPSWTRLIYRLHQAGRSQQIYANNIAGIRESRTYPRQVVSQNEDSSSSVDGSQLWRMQNWGRGIVDVDEDLKQVTFTFLSKKGETFHKVVSTSESEWNCFSCLVKVFSQYQLEENVNLIHSHEKNIKSSVQHSIGGVSKMISDMIGKGGEMKFTMPTPGGLIIRNMRVSQMVTKGGVVSLKSDFGSVYIDSDKINRTEVSVGKGGSIGALFDHMGIPKLIVEAA